MFKRTKMLRRVNLLMFKRTRRDVPKTRRDVPKKIFLIPLDTTQLVVLIIQALSLRSTLGSHLHMPRPVWGTATGQL